MEDPTDSVVDRLALREGLVSTFMGDDPKAGREKTDKEGVERPKDEARSRVEVGVRQRDVLRGDERVEEGGGLPDGANDHDVHHAGGGMSMARDDTSKDA